MYEKINGVYKLYIYDFFLGVFRGCTQASVEDLLLTYQNAARTCPLAGGRPCVLGEALGRLFKWCSN